MVNKPSVFELLRSDVHVYLFIASDKIGYPHNICKALLISTHNIFFQGEIRKISGHSCSKLTMPLVIVSLKL